MAQVILHYRGVTNYRGYIYYTSDSLSGGVQYEKGTEVLFPVDYLEREEHERYPVFSPIEGWMNKAFFDSIDPVYGVGTDVCTPPESVTLNTSTKVLTITGGAGGEQNDFTGYGISWRDGLAGTLDYGEWTADVVISATEPQATYAVAAPAAGYVREFRVRTMGSAGSEYYSSYVVCGTLLSGNTAPNAPTIIYPQSGASTYSAAPVVKVYCPADPDADKMSLVRKVDSGAWEPLGTLNGDYVLDVLPALGDGNHTIHYKLMDSYGAESASISIEVTKLALTWTRTIATGTVISSKEVSHQADIRQMLNVLNVQRAWYGNGAVTLAGTIGRFGDWKAQMEQMQAAIEANAEAAGLTVAFDAVPGYPAAKVINAIRTQLATF